MFFLVLRDVGKRQLWRMIAGLESVTEGDIIVDGVRVNDLPPKDRDVAMVFQSYGLYPNMTVRDNIRFPLKVRKIPKHQHEERVNRAAAMVELQSFMDRKPAALSGGQRQRVALARAIVREPNVFLMDEPLSNLDAKLRVSTRAQIKNLQHELQVTTIYVTHDQIEAMTLADRVVVMNKGKIQQVGTPTQIYDEPANTFVASFIGSPAMNLVAGQLTKGVFTQKGLTIKGLQGPDGTAILGFRAEDVNLSLKTGELQSEVYAFELLGDATMVTVRIGNGDDTSLVSIKAPKEFRTAIGETINVSINAKLCHLFDGSTGDRLDG